MATYSADGWSSGALVPTADVTTYGAARGWADWLAATDGAKDAAVLDASTWVRAVWTAPAEYDADDDAVISDAIAEASRLALSGPLMGGATSAQRTRVQAGSVSVEYAQTSARSLSNDRLSLVNAMLRSAGATGFSSINARLLKA